MNRLLLFILTIYFPLISIAQTKDKFSDIVSEIEANNLVVSVSKQSINSEKADLSTINNLSDPELEFSHQWGQKGIGNKWGIGISQSFEWPGVYQSRKKRISSEQMALEQIHRETIRKIRFEIRCSLIDIAYYKQLISITQSQMNRIDSLYSLYLKGVSLGEISKLDINKLKIERISASRQLNEAENAFKECVAKIVELNGGKDCSKIVSNITEIPNDELLSMDYYKSKSLLDDPTATYRLHQSDALNYQEQELKRSNIPGFSLGYNHDYELGEHFNGVSIGLILPIFSNKNKKAAIDQRRLLIESEKIEAENSLKSTIETSYGQVLNLDREICQYNSVLKDSDNIRLLDIALKSGHITLIEYLLEINYFIYAHKQLLEINRQRAINMSKLTQWIN